MKLSIKILFSVLIGIIGVTIIYIIAKDTFKSSDLILNDCIRYYNEGLETNSEKKLLAAERCFESEEKFNNQKAYPYLGHIKLILRKPKEAEKYLLLALEHLEENPDSNVKQNVLLNLGSTYLNLNEDQKAKKYLEEASQLGDKTAEDLLKKYNL